VIHDVCLQNLHVVFALDRAGLVGEDGPTHHGVFDISFLRIIPNLILMAPCDGQELKMMLKYSMKIRKPFVIRYPRGKTEEIDFEIRKEPISLAKAQLIKKGKGEVIISYGNQLDRALKMAKRKKNSAVYNARFAKPLDEKMIKAIKKAGKATIIEENAKAGGFASAVLEKLSKSKINAKIKIIGIEDDFVEHGEVDYLRREYLK